MKQDFENKKLILASQSPRRHSLIKKLNVDFEVAVPSFDEKLESDDYSDDKIESLSLKKALSVLDNHKVDDDRTGGKSLKNSFVISADTVVVLENKILGKPKDEAHALQMLKDLSGKKHFVVTSISIVDSETRNFVTELVKTYVTFQSLDDALILDYVKTKRPLDKAGSYGIQEMGPEFIKEIEGDLENVIGLPTKTLKNMLIKLGYNFSG